MSTPGDVICASIVVSSTEVRIVDGKLTHDDAQVGLNYTRVNIVDGLTLMPFVAIN